MKLGLLGTVLDGVTLSQNHSILNKLALSKSIIKLPCRSVIMLGNPLHPHKPLLPRNIRHSLRQLPPKTLPTNFRVDKQVYHVNTTPQATVFTYRLVKESASRSKASAPERNALSQLISSPPL